MWRCLNWQGLGLVEGMSRVLIYDRLPNQPLPECKYLYEAEKQLLLEPIQSTRPLILSAVLSTSGPKKQGPRFILGAGQPSRLLNP